MSVEQELSRLRTQVESLTEHNARLAMALEFEKRRRSHLEMEVQQMIESMAAAGQKNNV